eukprot:UN05724
MNPSMFALRALPLSAIKPRGFKPCVDFTLRTNATRRFTTYNNNINNNNNFMFHKNYFQQQFQQSQQPQQQYRFFSTTPPLPSKGPVPRGPVSAQAKLDAFLGQSDPSAMRRLDGAMLV